MQTTIESTNIEQALADDEFITLKTDLEGNITYANRSFIRLSGYEEHELIGQPHKMLRHQAMPRAIFRLMWETLETSNEFVCYLKYLRKDGGCFWSFVSMTPSYDDNQKVNGSYSVQRKPHPARKAFFEKLYPKMLATEKQYSTDKESMNASTAVLSDAIDGRDYDEFIFKG